MTVLADIRPARQRDLDLTAIRLPDGQTAEVPWFRGDLS
jgi:hypothetical protein